MLVTAGFGEQFGINWPNAFLEILKLAEWDEGNFKIFKYEGDLSQKSSKPNMWLLVNHAKPTNTLY